MVYLQGYGQGRLAPLLLSVFGLLDWSESDMRSTSTTHDTIGVKLS
jgi:hypothetical protein